jgi:hypothetical protein
MSLRNGSSILRIPNNPVDSLALLEHLHEHRDFSIDVVVDVNLRLLWVWPVKPPGVLNESCSPQIFDPQSASPW